MVLSRLGGSGLVADQVRRAGGKGREDGSVEPIL